MKGGRLEHSPAWMKGLQWLVVTVLLTMVVLLVWGVLPIAHQSVGALKWFQFIQTIATFLLPPLAMAWLWSRQPFRWLQMDRVPQWSLFVGAVVLMLVALPGINLLADWNSRMSLPAFLKPIEELMRQQEDAAMALTERFLRVNSVGALLINIGLMALLPAFAEELTFRGVLQQLLSGHRASAGRNLIPKQHMAIWVVAVIFSAIHFQFYGFVPRTLLGALFGYMLYFTGSLWIPIVMHFTNNAMTVLAYWYIYNKNLNPDLVETFGTGDTTLVGVTSIVLLFVGGYAMCRLSRTISSASSRIS